MVLWESGKGEIQLLKRNNLEDGVVSILQTFEGSEWNLGVDWENNSKESMEWMKETAPE